MIIFPDQTSLMLVSLPREKRVDNKLANKTENVLDMGTNMILPNTIRFKQILCLNCMAESWRFVSSTAVDLKRGFLLCVPKAMNPTVSKMKRDFNK